MWDWKGFIIYFSLCKVYRSIGRGWLRYIHETKQRFSPHITYVSVNNFQVCVTLFQCGMWEYTFCAFACMFSIFFYTIFHFRNVHKYISWHILHISVRHVTISLKFDLLVYLCICAAVPIVAVNTKKLPVTSDQEAYHSCFPDLISTTWAKLPLGSQFSFFLIGALIKSETHIVLLPLKSRQCLRILCLWVCLCM